MTIRTFALVFLVIHSAAFLSAANADSFFVDLALQAEERTKHHVVYDGHYYPITYPNGDIPADKGVCTDVVIRAYRALGYDLQKSVHEDMIANFAAYPSRRLWGLTAPDANIDHRRVPNLQVFFRRHGTMFPVSRDPMDYEPGDLVTWLLPGNLPHIGIVSSRKNGDNPLIVHNIGSGPNIEDMLFKYQITGHYRFKPKSL